MEVKKWGFKVDNTSNTNRGDRSPILEMVRSLPAWNSAVVKLSTRVSSPEIKGKVVEIQNVYSGARGPMVIDVVASRRRRYETHVAGRIIPVYKENAQDFSLKTLAEHGPVGVTLWSGEARTIVQLAEFLLDFAEDKDEERTVASFASQSFDPEVRARAIEIRGIGPVLYEYLRLLSGVDTLKSDSRVREALGSLGIPEENFSDEGILNICKALAADCECNLVGLDQALWNR
jgi:hypothetical protein